MLKSLTVDKFTVFEHATFEFGDLNVIHGENGAGKTHVLKLAYSILASLKPSRSQGAPDQPTKEWLDRELARKLKAVLRPDSVGRLARRQTGRNRADISAGLYNPSQSLSFSFNTASKSKVDVDKLPATWALEDPVYLPTREALSLFPGFVPIYESTGIALDETWRDLCGLLDTRRKRGAPTKSIMELLAPIEGALGGSLKLDDERFYLETKTGRMEIDLVAEGLRKFAMIAWLIANERLQKKGALLWDEPEANLNPRLIKKLAPLLLGLAGRGVQVFIATHSLYLMRELHILQREYEWVETQYFGLSMQDDHAVVAQGPTIDDSGSIASLDEDLEQSDRYIDVETKAALEPDDDASDEV